ncbi:DUF2309 domain-containing protein [Haloarcula pelagica]|uniref:DUF2309 domain-containing protein n=1 Tax=Haloarcula pelagica TaxID=3033389 RepID=UPI0024C241B6|nr:DUF2309 domain-containing protein [Halomicroarcula sp. YJ-61-S]
MSTDPAIRESIERAAAPVGRAWPLHSFVTANPLAGFEDEPFPEAVRKGADRFGGDGYPDPDVFEAALADGRIDTELLTDALAEHGCETDPEATLDRMREAPSDDAETAEETPTDRVDAVLTKWLAAFLDEGQATWPMPDREQGFFAAFHAAAQHDGEIPETDTIAALPDEPIDALHHLLGTIPPGEWEDLFEYHLTALPGWTGYVKQRAADGGEWQSSYPITLAGYLAARLALVEAFDAPLEPPTEDDATDDDDTIAIAEAWLSAWEGTYRGELVEAVADESAARDSDDGRPDAQFVFCIDTRSEVVRRHIEATGDYETHGYAGFFGVPMRYEGYDADVAVDACPPIADAEHRIADRPSTGEDAKQHAHDHQQHTVGAGQKVLKKLKSNAATAFSFVESAGAGYGAALAARTLLPARVADAIDTVDDAPEDHEFCAPTVDYNPDAVAALREGLTHEEKVEYAETAFDLMGWEQFARVVVFAGHASETANNPFESSLDCGACAGNPGGPSSRVLAAICNDGAVKADLRERGFDIPEDTVFVAGEHNTTTDEVTLYDGSVPESHAADLEQLEADLDTAQSTATAERTDADDSVRETERRAADWAETRPEWGLAGNAGFVIGPRALTENLDLDGRSFLHSYDWATDPAGDDLEAIMAGPMVVTQWINTQYYFSTVDPAVYGSGSKVTQNPVGNVGVYQGNGGDLLTGLPLQSVHAADDEPYHQPLRLSTVIHAPVERVTDILAENDEVAELLDNGWLSLTVVDPEQEHRAFHYDGDLEWTTEEAATSVTTPTVTSPADD